MKSIFLSGGLGDFIALESHFPPELKTNLETVYYATRSWEQIQQLFEAVPNEYPALKNHRPLWKHFIHYWATKDKAEFAKIANMLPVEWNRAVDDWSISERFPMIRRGRFPFVGSSFIKNRLAKSIDPGPYVVIHPDTTDWRPRRIMPNEWDTITNELDREGVLGVVLNTGDHTVPDHPAIINLTNQTNLLEAIEIVKDAVGFIGIDSCFSVLASQLFPAERIKVKSKCGHLHENKEVYYAPQKDFSFIVPSLDNVCPTSTC